MDFRPLGKTGIAIPRLAHGTSSLGNLYEAVSDEDKLAICRAWFDSVEARPVFIDSAGKYGAGLALEVLGDSLRRLNVAADSVVISNKLGWKRVALRSPEPTFEPGVWKNLAHDAEQCISYRGILECWEQGRALLGEPYRQQLVSVHDPDEYLAAAANGADRATRWEEILGAYGALHELKARGEVDAVGVGAKDWRIIDEIERAVELDWVMIAGSLTVYRHPPEAVGLVERLAAKGVGVINSAVFQAGFLVGGKYLDYRLATPQEHGSAFEWREALLALCRRHAVSPATACVQFALSPPSVAAVALNTSSPQRVPQNIAAVEATMPAAFWREAKASGLIDTNYPWV
jgi:D-threo-aldose 1-dehydrogenase